MSVSRFAFIGLEGELQSAFFQYKGIGDEFMNVSSVSSSSGILKEESLEQQKQLRQQQTDSGSEVSADAAKAASADAGTAVVTAGDTTGNQALISKANSGAELNESELSTLKQVDPALYARVVKAQKIRAEARNKMSENPSNSAQIMRDAVSQNTSEDDETQNLIDRALVNEYKNFASKYDQVIISGR
jgi:hypothetical protein